MEFKYFQFASPFNQFPRAITTSAVVDNYWDESKSNNTGRSWQFFDESLIDYHKLNGSTSGFRGKSDSPIIPIDIDNISITNLRNTLDKLHNLLGDLDHVHIYFSGKKGYHIEIPSCLFAINPTENLPERMKRLVSKMEIGADLSLYKSNQLYRMENSLNVSGGYYKTEIPMIDIDDGININEIKHLAEKPFTESFEMPKKGTILWDKEYWTRERDWLVDLWDETECPDNTKLQVNGGVPEGYRNANATDTAYSLKTQEYPREIAKKVIEEQNKKNIPPEPNLSELLRSVDSVYNGKYFKKFPINPILQQLQEDAYWDELNDKRKVVFIRMLMEANVREHVFHGFRIKRNQLVYGKESTAKRWGINEHTLVSILNKFEKDGIISKLVIKESGKSKFTIITLLTFDVTQPFTHKFNE